ncbi:MAG TPA: response regulator [Candidatus Limnocylindrales bacterium]|nr:response regulator [Candidatus Limnocylindrales bacterium]
MAIRLRTLIVEDSEDDAALIVRELGRGGFDVQPLRVDSADALNAALDSGEWDIVISDYSMPGFSGSEALKLVRARNSEVPFLYVSGTLGEETAVAALRSGAQDYLVKGNLRRLVPAIEREMRDAEGRRERKKLEVQIHQLRRFESLGRLAGGIAHDFNNVIGAILGWAEMGEQELPEGTKSRERFQKIQFQAQRAGGLTRQLLAFARRQVLQPRSLEINNVVLETVNLLGPLIGEQIQIDLALAPQLGNAWADATQIEQVIMNLCINARDAMPQGGQLRVQTEEAEIFAGDENLRPSLAPGKYVLLSIADTGTGMDAATLEQIFEPFFTTKEVGKGTGLGLATVYGIVKQHGGMIDVESQLDVGSKFRVYLPVTSETAKDKDGEGDEPLRGGSETVLVGEDHEGLREAARDMLQALGYNVLLATNGKEAVELFREKHASIDLVLLDVVMPELNGPAAFQEMSAIKPHLPAIFATGYASEAESLRSLVKEGVALIQKPYNSQALGKKIRKLLDKPA